MADPTMGQKITDSLSGIGNSLSNAATSANENIQSAVTNAGESISAAKDSFNNTMSDFSSKTSVAVNDTGFLDSNSIIAKFGFLIIVVVLFIFLLQLGLAIISYFINNPNPVLIPGQIVATMAQPPITQNPGLASSLQVLWSNNALTGLEYTWSVWLQYAPGPEAIITTTAGSTTGIFTLQPVFIKGDCKNLSTYTAGVPVISSSNSIGTNKPEISVNNGPGLYFYNNINSAHLYLLVDTVGGVGQNLQIIDISNIPINKYFHLAIRCQNIYIDIYINGSIVQRTKLNSVPKQNYYDVNVCPAGGFSGYLSTLQYFNSALSVVDINAIASGKPDTRMITNSDVKISQSNYLSTSWYNNFMR